jgi:cobalamin biosynthesis protein CobW
MSPAVNKRVPVLLVSGFLGSGKTTLVRHLLQSAQAQGTRVAVISNEFGALGIDKALLGEGEEAYVELEGGCVCCQLSDDLRDTLQMLWERVQPDQVIVETSGVALPSDIQLQFWREPVSTWVEDDMVLVVVNAEQVAEGRDLHGTFADQVSSADLLLLNKVDLAAAADLPRLEAVLQEIAPETPVLHASYGNLAPAVLFPPDPAGLRAQRRQAPPPHKPHAHEAFVSEVLSIEEHIEPAVLLARLRQRQILRAKGFVHTSQGLRVVQGVGRRLELSAPVTTPPAALVGRVVVIRRATADEAS